MFYEDTLDLEAIDGERRRPLWQKLASPKVAALDLGASSFHLIITELNRHGRHSTIARHKERVQIGEGSFETGLISPEAFERGLQAIRRLGDVVRQQAPEAVIAVATSALREAKNGREFVRAAAAAGGFPIRLIDGLEEARLMHLGARQAVPFDAGRIALVDFGGGSTEIIVASDAGCELTASLRLGGLRLRNQWTCADPPSGIDVLHLQELIADAVKPTLAHVRRLGFGLLVLSCGTARTLCRLANAEPEVLAEPPRFGTGENFLTLDALRRLEVRLCSLSAPQRALLAGTDPERTDTLLPGTVALRVILERLGVERALVTATGLREGLVADYASKRETQRARPCLQCA